MKLSIDTEGADSLLARMYLAAVIGPSRRPSSRANQVTCPLGAGTQLVLNQTSNRVLAVTVIQPLQAPVLVQFTQAGGAPFSVLLGNVPGIVPERFFVLKPGESLSANPAVTVAISVFTETF